MMAGIAAIQYKFETLDYLESYRFKEKMIKLGVEASKLIGSEGIIVYPENVGVFLVLEGTKAFESEDISSTLKKLVIKNFPKLVSIMLTNLTNKWTEAILIWKSKPMLETYVKTFEEVARKSGCYVVAGSTFVKYEGKVRNISYTFDPEGKIIGVQRKVHITPPEYELGLHPSSIEKINAFETEFGKIGVAICYDSFFDDVVSKLRKDGAEILIQPSANAELTWDKAKEIWWKGCYSMTKKYGFKYGVNPMGVGKILGFQFEGISSIIDSEGRYLDKAEHHFQEDIVFIDKI
ncbi:MAG: hypothetical protein N3F64_01060 [Nitrososphaeria archaeon]|nr:hypothetical protein [Nitrososphaeria archaeon]